ncbi:RidA family protein [Pusillimonas sp. SM2304]|uniref:RidA family protein n=1 Tax=Pusillimonas sp. SM2304 TaxID=3073241 RepID=UPI0028758569|nr:RidA family protein [Pusillimonas sp. SM2304]MDS1140177.1 RidA family protein [Pusillimonas sp. SM2304]
MKRTSIYTEGFSHKNPIPAACRIGNTVHTGSILGTDVETGQYGETLEAQCQLMFAHIDRIIRAAGGTPENIIKMTVWMKDRTQRQAVNAEWLKMFPDAQSRPARHTMDAPLDGDKLIECSFIAILD